MARNAGRPKTNKPRKSLRLVTLVDQTQYDRVKVLADQHYGGIAADLQRAALERECKRLEELEFVHLEAVELQTV